MLRTESNRNIGFAKSGYKPVELKRHQVIAKLCVCYLMIEDENTGRSGLFLYFIVV